MVNNFIFSLFYRLQYTCTVYMEWRYSLNLSFPSLSFLSRLSFPLSEKWQVTIHYGHVFSGVFLLSETMLACCLRNIILNRCIPHIYNLHVWHIFASCCQSQHADLIISLTFANFACMLTKLPNNKNNNNMQFLYSALSSNELKALYILLPPAHLYTPTPSPTNFSPCWI